jgi:hypothetical protein
MPIQVGPDGPIGSGTAMFVPIGGPLNVLVPSRDNSDSTLKVTGENIAAPGKNLTTFRKARTTFIST